MKPIFRLSGEKNGSVPPSVPAMSVDSRLFSRRSTSCGMPSRSVTWTIELPSGDSATSEPSVPEAGGAVDASGNRAVRAAS